MAGPAASIPGARCARHPDVAAVATCARCGSFLCGACTEVQGETAYCEPCIAWRTLKLRPSRAVGWLLAANVVGLVLFTGSIQLAPGAIQLALGTLLAGVIGAVQSTLELRRIPRGERGRRPALALSALSAVSVLCAGVFLAGLGYLLLRFRGMD